MKEETQAFELALKMAMDTGRDWQEQLLPYAELLLELREALRRGHERFICGTNCIHDCEYMMALAKADALLKEEE